MTRNQQFAVRAMRAVTAFSESLKDTRHADALRKDYLTRAKGFPAMVMQSGLVQSIGFLVAKSTPGDSKQGDEADSSKKHEAYLHYANSLASVLAYKRIDELHGHAIGKDGAPDYRQLTRDVLLAATHLRRYAQIELKTDAAAKSEKAQADDGAAE
jgi:CRISPR-associated protein Cmr5